MWSAGASGNSVSPGAGWLRTWAPLGAWRVEGEFGECFQTSREQVSRQCTVAWSCWPDSASSERPLEWLPGSGIKDTYTLCCLLLPLFSSSVSACASPECLTQTARGCWGRRAEPVLGASRHFSSLSSNTDKMCPQPPSLLQMNGTACKRQSLDSESQHLTTLATPIETQLLDVSSDSWQKGKKKISLEHDKIL